jgi:hypothetical protein
VDSGHTYDYVEVFSHISKCFPRVELIRQSHEHPDMIDAKLSGIYLPYTRGNLVRLGMPEKQEISFVDVTDHMRFTIDG